MHYCVVTSILNDPFLMEVTMQEMHPEEVDGLANSVAPDQSA